ncbi:PhnD/SsuA/transferrin family substrate-binding protein [Aquabacterium sp. J223]|uniref:PhnD/SsuA/transferrin family substrate-binding protein n=1 Tax=Aquabacterium sp. J223 TaxID=2898431 RepID=UPI0021ADA9C2|nr:PhnD/SsuA/transferrin family substrate-binding protein [Aquabacterium sp. J223]UUX96176.1 PhnD/SsuA/transferrin family substrate-binding protein [Aquabacterium sp. J223]
MPRPALHRLCAALCIGLALPAQAELSALVAAEPTARKEAQGLPRAAMESSLGKAVGQPLTVTTTEDLADAMRATRSGGYDVFIAPPQVAASALGHGYELVGATEGSEQYVLVARQGLASVAALKGGRLYLPQQESIYSYLARGMLNAQGLSLKDLRKVEYARYPQAGLAALSVGATDATVVRQSDWEAWAKDNANQARSLATSMAVPGGFSVVVRSSLPADQKAKLARWFAQPVAFNALKPASQRPDLADYKAIAQLGIFTPVSLPGAKVVTPAEVKDLMAGGAMFVDTRTSKEFLTKRVPKAVFAPYVEKSLKDTAFDPAQDDFTALAKLNLDKDKPTIFACNGAECWKSYKASKHALAQGFKQVYWFRGGLPAWEAAGLPVSQGD